MDQCNKDVVISCPQMEAGWMRLLIRSYKNYDPTARAIEQGFEYDGKMESLLWWKQMMLNHAMWQVCGPYPCVLFLPLLMIAQKRGMHNNNRETPEQVERYWEERAMSQPGLDIIVGYPVDSPIYGELTRRKTIPQTGMPTMRHSQMSCCATITPMLTMMSGWQNELRQRRRRMQWLKR